MNKNLPPVQTGKAVWYGSEMESKKEEWILHLSDSEINELEEAAQHFLSKGTPIEHMTEDRFPLPTFGIKLKSLREKLINGIGFFILRGLPIEKYSERESATNIFWHRYAYRPCKVAKCNGSCVGPCPQHGIRQQ